MELDDSMAGGITMSDVIPVSDEDGLSQEGYTFTLENKGKVMSDYTIYLDDLDLLENQIRMKDSYIRYQLTRDGEEIGFDLLNTIGEHPNRILDSGTIKSGKKYTYVLKMWIDSNTDNEVMGTTFKGQLRVEAVQSVYKPPATEALLEKVNPVSLTYASATDAQKREMFTFTHTAGTQQKGWTASELTDYRYIGTSPNNYVRFNDEIWRILGIFTVEDAAGKKEQRIKIIRNQSIGNYSWDNTGSYGYNDWSTSALQKVLTSGAYYNRTSGTCPNSSSGHTTSCNFSSNGLTESAKNMIGKEKWYLGGFTLASNPSYIKTYEYERGTNVYSGRPTSWVGEVSLMYSSDYGYATSESSCLTNIIANYRADCTSNNWLHSLSSDRWIITIFPDRFNAYRISSTAGVSFQYVYNTSAIFPVVYLKSNVKILAGDGNSSSPYVLKYDEKT